MPTLSAVIKLQDNYSSVIDKIIGSTEAADNKIKSLSDNVDKLNTKLSDIETTATGINREIKSMTDTFKNLEGMDSGVSDLSESMLRIREAAAKGIKGVKLLAGSFKDFAAMGSEIIGRLGALMLRIGEAAGKGLGRIKSLGGALKGLASIGVGKLTAALSRVGEAVGKGLGRIKSLGDSLKGLAGIGVGKLTAALSRIGAVAGKGLESIKSLGGSLKGLAGIGVGKLTAALSRIGAAAGKGLGSIRSLGSSLKGLAGIGVGKLTAALSRIGAAAGKGIGGIKLIAGSVTGVVGNAIKIVGKLSEKFLGIRGVIGKAAGAIKPFGQLFTKLAGGFLTLGNAQKVLNIADTYTNTSAKLDLINTGPQPDDQLQDKIFAAASRSRGSYTDMASNIVKLGTTAKNSFGGNDELIAFTELVQKSFKAGGASKEEQQAGMDQIIKSMSAGEIQGSDFKSIMENAPLVADAIEKFTGKSKEDLMSLSDGGSISADIIKKSMFAASNEINEKFSNTPMTFADVFGQIKDGALHAFGPVIERITGIMSSPGFQKALNSILGVIKAIAKGIDWVISIVQSNWGTIAPILLSIIGALALIALVYLPIMLVQWMMLNWPILLIVAIIAFLIYSMIKFGDTVAEVVGVVGGIFGGLFAFLYNCLAFIINPFISFVEFFANIFNDPIYSIEKLFVDLATNVLNLVQSIASAIDSVLGTRMADSLQSLKNGMQDWLGPKPENYKEFTKLQMADITSSVNFGYDTGKKGVSAAVAGIQGLSGKLSGMGKIPTADETPGVGQYMQNGALPVTGEDGGSMKVDMSDEDLKYLQDIAEREYINKFSTATLAPNVSISFGNVTKEVDVDNVIRRVGKIMSEEIAMVSEGGYAV